MDPQIWPEVAKLIGAGIAGGFGAIGPGIGIGILGMGAINNDQHDFIYCFC
jgi:F0F1-type ATP synthase membrane subunit c/vacuolar-type H+-ATPase subunit K